MSLSSEVESWELQTKINQQKGKVINAQLIRDEMRNTITCSHIGCSAWQHVGGYAREHD